jgi:phosphoribosyl 1,2-cyclic phosphodiesterase
VRLTFLGTRGGIAISSRRHRRHTSLLLQHGKSRIMIDCGTDWLHRLSSVAPTAIVITHAHPDHAGGLARGAHCPVYATRTTWSLLGSALVQDRHALPLRRPIAIDRVMFKAFPVAHSKLVPTVGLRIRMEKSCVVYIPDVADILDRPAVLRGIDAYIGDGAAMQRTMVRRRGRTLIGHAPIAAQLDWCEEAGVRQAIFTHCGSPIVGANAAQIDVLGLEHGMEARVPAGQVFATSTDSCKRLCSRGALYATPCADRAN